MNRDPVCGMTVDDESRHRSPHAGKTYLFCSPSCKTRFDKEPERYVAPAGGEVHRGSQP